MVPRNINITDMAVGIHSATGYGSAPRSHLQPTLGYWLRGICCLECCLYLTKRTGVANAKSIVRVTTHGHAVEKKSKSSRKNTERTYQRSPRPPGLSDRVEHSYHTTTPRNAGGRSP